MRTIHWLYLITVVLFVASVGLVIVSARAAQRTAAFVTPVASIKEIMNGMVEPGSKVVFDAVATNITVKGIEEIAPKNDAEWQNVRTRSQSDGIAGGGGFLDGAEDPGVFEAVSQADKWRFVAEDAVGATDAMGGLVAC